MEAVKMEGDFWEFSHMVKAREVTARWGRGERAALSWAETLCELRCLRRGRTRRF